MGPDNAENPGPDGASPEPLPTPEPGLLGSPCLTTSTHQAIRSELPEADKLTAPEGASPEPHLRAHSLASLATPSLQILFACFCWILGLAATRDQKLRGV
jgi:hypothetical protein